MNYYYVIHYAKSTASENSLHPYSAQQSLKFSGKKERWILQRGDALVSRNYLHGVRLRAVLGLGNLTDLLI